MLSRSIRGNPRLALAAVGLATFMTSLDNTVVNVALPSIQRDLRLSIGGLEWVAATALLGQHASFGALMGPLAAVGIGSGLTMPITAAILGVLPRDQAGVAGAILNVAREASGLLGVTVIGAILAARQGAALAAGATPHAAFLAGYSAGLATAAALVLAGGVIALRTMPGRPPATTLAPLPRPVQVGSGRSPATATPPAASAAPPRAVALSRPGAQPPRAA